MIDLAHDEANQKYALVQFETINRDVIVTFSHIYEIRLQEFSMTRNGPVYGQLSGVRWAPLRINTKLALLRQPGTTDVDLPCRDAEWLPELAAPFP